MGEFLHNLFHKDGQDRPSRKERKQQRDSSQDTDQADSSSEGNKADLPPRTKEANDAAAELGKPYAEDGAKKEKPLSPADQKLLDTDCPDQEKKGTLITLSNGERVHVHGDVEAGKAEAESIVKEIKEKYQIDVSSQAGIEAIKKEYAGAPGKIKDQLSTFIWEITDLRALLTALNTFAPIMQASQKSGEQLLQTVSKVKRGITSEASSANNQNPCGPEQFRTDSQVNGETFKDAGNISLFARGSHNTDYLTKEPEGAEDYQQAEVAIWLHELTHLFLAKGELQRFIDYIGYWKVTTEAGICKEQGAADAEPLVRLKTINGKEPPPTPYAGKAPEEDLCDSVTLFLTNPGVLLENRINHNAPKIKGQKEDSTLYPQNRYDFVEQMLSRYNTPAPGKK